MKTNSLNCQCVCTGIPLETRLPNNPGASIRVDVRFQRNAAKAIRRDKPAYSVDWGYLADRIRRVTAAGTCNTAEALAARIAQLVFADMQTPMVEVTIRMDKGGDAAGAPAFQLEFRRKGMLLGPRTPAVDAVRSQAIRACGTGVKILARPFHLLLPSRRWTMPPVDPARATPRSETPIPRILWQTNFTDRCSLPVWLNYRRNRRLSADFEHRYVSTEARAEYMAKSAPPHVAAAYARLTDGAAQADLWRLVTLYREGGVYLDIDASLVRPLSAIVAGHDAVYLWDRKRFSNYFLATVPGNPVFAEFIDRVVDGIEHHHERHDRSVFYVTGPGALEAVLDAHPGIEYLPRKSVALTGAFTDEKYQYIDRPRGKWTNNPKFIVEKAGGN